MTTKRQKRAAQMIERLESRRLLAVAVTTPTLVKNIEPHTLSGSPQKFTEVNGAVVFSGSADGGGGLFRTDGTPAGTSLLMSGAGAIQAKIGNEGIFLATGGLHATDGTAAGTRLIKAVSGITRQWMTVGSSVYFGVDPLGNSQYNLWRTDGTTAGTGPVLDTSGAGIRIAVDTDFAVLNGNTLMFVEGSTYQLGRTDGTQAGTYRITVNPSGFAEPRSFSVVGNHMYFGAKDGVTGSELWKTDGTVAGTALVKDILPGASGSFPGKLYTINGVNLFTANDGGNNFELWTTDGTANGTQLFKEFYAGPTSGGITGPWAMLNGQLIFAANTDTGGYKLFKTDGTVANTVAIGSTFATSNYTDGYVIVTENGSQVLYFLDSDVSLHRTDGNTVSYVQNMTAPQFNSQHRRTLNKIGDTVYFMSGNGISGGGTYNTDEFGFELRKVVVNGANISVQVVKDIAPGFRVSGLPDDDFRLQLTSINGRLYFGAGTAETGVEPWVSDGTAAGMQQLAELNHEGFDVHVGLSKVYKVGNNRRVFFASTPATGVELWVTDGTEAGTSLLKDCYPGATGCNPLVLGTVDGILYFRAAQNSTTNDELWRTDGTAAGTFSLKDIHPSVGGSNITAITRLGYRVVFSAMINSSERELWVSDGTQAGTFLLRNFNGTGSGAPEQFAAIGDRVYFSATDTGTGAEMWTTDGTVAGTQLLADINPGAASSTPGGFAAFNGNVYFSATGPAGDGAELWRTDGTSGNATRVKDINPGPNGSSPSKFTVAGGKLFFAAAGSGTQDYELWKTDGTDAGTVRIKDLVSGTAGSYPEQLTEWNGRVLFAAMATGGTQRRLWVSDGTDAGTINLTPSVEAVIHSSTGPFVFNTDRTRVFFVGSTATTGQEVWSSDGTLAGTLLPRENIPGNGTGVFNFSAAVALGDTIFYPGATSVYSEDLAWTDGTPAGSGLLVVDGDPAFSDGVVPGTFSVIDDTLWLGANNGISGAEIFRMANFAEVAGSTLKVKLPPSGGTLTVTPSGGDAIVNRNGEVLVVPGAAAVGAIEVIGSAGDDSVALNLPRPLTFSGGGGTDSVTLSGGAFTLSGDAGAGGQVVDVTVQSGGSLLCGTTQHLRTLNLDGGAVSLTPGGAKVLSVQSFTHSGAGTLDLADNDLIVHAGDHAAIEAAIIAGANAGDWLGNGIRTSQQAAIDGLTTLGVARAADVLDFASPTATALFSGETVTGSAILVKYTYAGDANLDGIISGDDYAAIDLNIAMPGASGYSNGDFNHDGIISGDDYAAIDLNIVAQGSPL